MGEVEPRLIFWFGGSPEALFTEPPEKLRWTGESDGEYVTKEVEFLPTFLTKITRSFYINPNCGGVFFFLGGAGRFAKLFLLDVDGWKIFFLDICHSSEKQASAELPAGIRVESAGLKGRVQVKFKDWVVYVAENRDIEDSYGWWFRNPKANHRLDV